MKSIETKNDFLQSERDQLDQLLKEVGFINGLDSLKNVVEIDDQLWSFCWWFSIRFFILTNARSHEINMVNINGMIFDMWLMILGLLNSIRDCDNAEADLPSREPNKSTDALESVFSVFDNGMYAISLVGSNNAYFNVFELTINIEPIVVR